MATASTTKGRLRWLLVLGLVLVPGAVLSVVTWRLIGQERELEASRLAERRALVAARVAQRMQSRLELERASARSLQLSGAVMPDTGVLVLVAPVTERGMALPWEGRAATAEAEESADYQRSIGEGERLEFARDRPDLAAASYRAASELATLPATRVDAELREARALSRAGRTDAALLRYGAVAETPVTVRDRDGMPLAMYGAEGLLTADLDAIGRVVTVLERVVDGTDLAPTALYAVRDLARSAAVLADSIPPADADDGLTAVERIRSVEQSATERIDVAERMLALRRDLPAVLSLAGSAGPDSIRSPARATAGIEVAGSTSAPMPLEWRPWGGPEPWLIGVSSDGSRRLVLVADPDRLLEAITVGAADDLGVALAEVSLSTVPSPDAELLGPGFPALFAILTDVTFQQGSGFGRVLLALVLPLVLAVTVLAAFLLWRDVRREIETAGLRAQFVSSVSHELKTPLTSIRMYAQTLLMGRYRAEADRRTYLETIVNESERLSRLIDNVLDFSRMERDGRSYRMEWTSLASVVQDAARAMSYPLEQGGFVLDVRMDDDVPAVRCDGDALTQAVVNLLSNAVKFSGSATSIELALVREEEGAAIRVRDHGPGIDRRHHAAVFERFFRTPEAESKGVPGTGLGLALVAHVANAHGGAVQLDSAPGQGSTFTIRLPLEPRPDRPDASDRNAAAAVPEADPGSTAPAGAAPTRPPDPSGSAGRVTNPEHVSR